MRIEVAGIPAPQGSKRHVGGGRMVEMSRAVGPWREAVRAETQRVMQAEHRWPSEEPVGIEITFRLVRPKSTPKRVEWPAKRPDLDKLARAVLDGITAGGAICDDGQVVVLYCWKQFADGGLPGCTIDIVDPKEFF
jgi:crossover junction endodeoxyribonuclease RusA